VCTRPGLLALRRGPFSAAALLRRRKSYFAEQCRPDAKAGLSRCPGRFNVLHNKGLSQFREARQSRLNRWGRHVNTTAEAVAYPTPSCPLCLS